MSRNPSLRLEDIVEGCDRLAGYLEGYDWERFQKDQKTQDAVARVFEIIGEAVKGVPDEWRELEPEIPWRQIAGFRDVLAHAYFAIETRIVWEAAVEKAPALRAACQRLLCR
ncbi:MAG: DUF86 domain-containing protein [Verrucomicrobia bacterium]|nr:DUF86 domain-containing protein [Verrucomicrobiota bacterium]